MAVDLPTEPFTAADIVPPVAVALIDQLLSDIGSQTFIDRRKVENMLLDIRNVLWVPNQHSMAAGPLVASMPMH